MKFFLILVLPLFGLFDAANAEPRPKRTCRIVFPERPNNSPKEAYLFDGKGSQQVSLPSMNFSEVVTLPAGEIVIALTDSPITDPETVPPSAPKLRIPETVQDFYILISPDPSNPALPLGMKLVNAGEGKLKPGETLWFNLTDHRILANLGESKMSVDPKSLTISKDPLPASGYYAAAFAYQPNAKGSVQRITEQHWWHDAKSRHIGFIVSSGGMLPKIYFYRDFR